MSRFNNLEFGEEFNEQQQAELERKPRVRQACLKDATYYLTEARASFEDGQFGKALRSYSKVLEFNPLSAEAWLGQVRMLIELEQFDQAKTWVDTALERFPNDPELLAAKAVALARLGDLKAALVYSDASIEERGNTPYIWLARADVQLARKERRADFSFEKAFSLAPKNWFIHWLAARVQYYYKRFAAALKLLQQALEWNAAQGILWLQMAMCQTSLGLLAPAKVSLQQARELTPDHPALDDLMRDLYRSGFWSRVRGRCRQWFTG